MNIRIRTFMVIGRISCTVVTLGWLLGVVSPAWGQTLGDFNGDGFADLAIGVPFESVGAVSSAGAVNILYGSATGLSGTGDQFFSQDTPEVAGVAETGDQFGAALAAGDFNGDGFADLAIGVPFEDFGTILQ